MKIEVRPGSALHSRLVSEGFHVKKQAYDVEDHHLEHFRVSVRKSFPKMSFAELDQEAFVCALTHPDHAHIKRVGVKDSVPNDVHRKRINWHRIIIAVLGILLVVLGSVRLAHCQKTKSDINVIKIQTGGSPVKTFAGPFTLNCSTNMTCAVSGSTLSLSSTGGGAATGYQTLQNASAAIAQEVTLNWTAGITCVDNAGATRSDCALKTVAAVSHQFFNAVTAGALVAAQPVAADIGSVPGSNGQLLFNNAGAIGAEDPIVSYNYVNLWTAQDVTITRTSATVRVSTFGAYGSLLMTWAGITGSPASCTVQIKSADSAGNLISNGSALSVSPANGTTSQAFSPAATIPTHAQMAAVFACVTYPTAGTLTLDFVPSITTFVPNTVAISAVSLPLPTGAALDSSLTTLDTDVKSNITLHAGANVIGHVIADSGSTTAVTGNVAVTQADGADTTLGAKADAKNAATDTTAVSAISILKEISSLEQTPASRAVTNAGTFAVQAAQSGNWTSRIVGNAGGLLDAIGQNVAAPANWLSIGCDFFTSPTTITTGNGSNLECDSAGNLLVNLKTAIPAGSNVIGHVITDSGSTTVVTGTVTANATLSAETTKVIGTVRVLGNGGATVDAPVGAGTAPTNMVAVGGLYNSTLPSPTTGQSLANQFDRNGRQWVTSYPDTNTTSYRASKKFAASSTTDNAVMPGNATNTVLVTKILLTCNQTTAGQINVELLKRSTADTAGTSAAMTAIPMDANYAAAVSAPLSYTGTGPTVGTAIGDLDNLQIGCMAAATATPNDIFIFHPDKPIILRGTAQQIAVNVGNAALTGGNVTVTFEWEETTTP